MTKQEKLENRMMEDDWYIIEMSSGEVIDTIGEGDSFSIKRKEQTKFLNEFEPNYKKGCNFLKKIDKNCKILYKKLTPTEYAFAENLMSYIGYNHNIIMNNRKIMSTKDIAVEFGLEYHNTRRMIRTLIDIGVLGEFRTGNINLDKKKSMKCLVFNPNIAFRGTTMNKLVINFFSKAEWK